MGCRLMQPCDPREMAPKKFDPEVNMEQIQQQMSKLVVTEMEQNRGRVDSIEQTLQTM
ncbi:hypothetical protein DY000_02025681 [Brassica cretica]|uniref:Uncharacterized protein n=1 Tax=Brassica cretica TaxID=69181 RepID=A0ABQ7E9V2_BRACR|nr:hypothetical protein DY000_02025681 [Brassica cretica]